MGFYAESYDRPNMSGVPAEDIRAGTIVATTASGLVQTDNSETAADGLALQPRSGGYVAEEMDEGTDFLYQPASSKTGTEADEQFPDRVPYADLNEAGAVFKCRTIADNGTDPAPSISDGTVVGVAHKDDDAFRGRLVEEGYTDNGATTYDEGSGNFTPVGVVRRDSADGHDEAVRFVVQN
jgi:hypothetical protein